MTFSSNLYGFLFLFLFCLLSPVVFSVKAMEEETARFLVGKTPPPYVRSSCDHCFDMLNIHAAPTSSWGLFNGSGSYDLLQVDQRKLAKKIVEDAHESGDTEVWIADIGAGNFESCHAFAKDLQERLSYLTGKIKIHIMGVRGEPSLEKEEEDLGLCHIHKLGSFKSEDFNAQLTIRGFSPNIQFNLVISRWSFRHFVNPLGTWIEIFNKIRVGGFFVTDWFYYLYGKEEFRTKGDALFSSRRHLLDVLHFLNQTQTPFLLHPYGSWSAKTLDAFLVQRKDASPLVLPLAYKAVRTLHDKNLFDVDSGEITEFEVLDSNFRALKLEAYFAQRADSLSCLFGSASLFNWILEHGLTTSYPTLFTQIYKIGETQDVSPLYTPQEEDLKRAEIEQKTRRSLALLENIETIKKEFFSSLKRSLPNPIPPAAEGRAHMARDIEWEVYHMLRKGDFVEAQTLLKKGADLSRYFEFGPSCENFLDCAVQGTRHFPKGSISFLLKNGAFTQKKGTLDNALYWYTPPQDIKLLVDNGVEIEDPELALYRSVDHDVLELVELFVSKGAQVNTFVNCHPIVFAAQSPEIWNYLVDHGAKDYLGGDLEKK